MKNKDLSIVVRNLTKAYGSNKAISNLSFDVRRGSVVGFLGPNGAGKSTTMRILAGIMPATSGVARVNGIPVSLRPQEVKRCIGFLPENNPLPEDVRVKEYLRHRARLKEVPYREQKARIEEVLDVCELAKTVEHKIIGTLSKGYRQRVGIADALLGNPEVLIMDEPTIGLDPHQILSIRRLIQGLEGKMTVLLSSHILPEIEACCNRFIIINRGHIVAEGSGDELKKEFNTKTTYSVVVRAPKTALHNIIREVDPTATIRASDEYDSVTRVTFDTMQPPEFGEVLVTRISKNPNWQIREIARQDPTLEDVFLSATRSSWGREGKGVAL